MAVINRRNNILPKKEREQFALMESWQGSSVAFHRCRIVWVTPEEAIRMAKEIPTVIAVEHMPTGNIVWRRDDNEDC